MPATASDLESLLREERVISTARELIAIPSVNPFAQVEESEPGLRELEVAERYAEMLAEVGCEVRLDMVVPGRPNVIATLKGSRPGPTVLLAGHLDTVGINDYQNPFEARVDNGRIYGRGSCDMKAALAAFVEVARVVNESGAEFGGELLIGGIADEEDRMVGSRHWAATESTPDYAIVGEPTSLVVCPAHKGQLGSTIRTFGKAVHSSLRSQGVNAIEKMAAVIAAFAGYNDDLMARPHHELVGHGTFSVGVISGGEIMSTVPDLCQIEVDRRMIPGETPEQIVAEYREILDPLVENDPDFSYEIESPTMAGGVLDTPLDNPVVTTTVSAMAAVTGTPGIVEAFTGATDAPNFGCPAVIYGPGALAQAHTLDEFVAIDELMVATRVYLRTTLGLLDS